MYKRMILFSLAMIMLIAGVGLWAGSPLKLWDTEAISYDSTAVQAFSKDIQLETGFYPAVQYVGFDTLDIGMTVTNVDSIYGIFTLSKVVAGGASMTISSQTYSYDVSSTITTINKRPRTYQIPMTHFSGSDNLRLDIWWSPFDSTAVSPSFTTYIFTRKASID